MSSWHKTSQQTLPVPITLIPHHDWWLYLELWARINTSSNKLPLSEFFITVTEKAAMVVRQVKYVLVPIAWSVFPSSRSNTFISKANQKLPLKVSIKIVKPGANEATASFWSFSLKWWKELWVWMTSQKCVENVSGDPSTWLRRHLLC